ncbi:MAG: hypothetical protein ACRD5E_05935, partial [Nitrososphaeraceae archaeon]
TVIIIVLFRIIAVAFLVTRIIPAFTLSHSGAFFSLAKLLLSNDIFEYICTNQAQDSSISNLIRTHIAKFVEYTKYHPIVFYFI